jgi:hypothetical protein
MEASQEAAVTGGDVFARSLNFLSAAFEDVGFPLRNHR